MSPHRIGTAARRSGLPIATLRNWELPYGLVTPIRTPGGQRLSPTPTRTAPPGYDRAVQRFTALAADSRAPFHPARRVSLLVGAVSYDRPHGI